jgi:hypothetical protein
LKNLRFIWKINMLIFLFCTQWISGHLWHSSVMHFSRVTFYVTELVGLEPFHGETKATDVSVKLKLCAEKL